MKHIRYILLSIAFVAGGLAYGPASAALPATLPAFAADLEQGTIDRVDLKRNEIIIGDGYFVLSSQVRVYSELGAPVTVRSLKQGMSIGFSLAADGSGQPAISNIVILSAD